jgi:hypothetical protein
VSGLSAAWWMGTCRLTFFHTRVCVSTDQWPPLSVSLKKN